MITPFTTATTCAIASMVTPLATTATRTDTTMITALTTTTACAVTAMVTAVTSATTRICARIVASSSFFFHCLCNHRIANQSHGTENREGFSCGFLEEFSSVLGFFLVVFHICFARFYSIWFVGDWLLFSLLFKDDNRPNPLHQWLYHQY